MSTSLSEARESVWFWTVFAVLGVVLAAVGWWRWAF